MSTNDLKYIPGATLLQTLNNYIQLTKPTIMLLVLLTGGTALVWEGSLLGDPIRFTLILLALFLTGGCANALNQYFERDIDARMERTAARRPLPGKRISSTSALIFSLSIGLVGVLILWIGFNAMSGLMALGTILFYSLFYTLVLKPNTPQNIVIGGAAGAFVPVGAWVAAAGEMSVEAWILFAIVFFWTPPHFWALALYCKDDYIKAKLPMMPLVRGDASTLRQIFVYTIIMCVVSLLPLIYGAGLIYLGVTLWLGMQMIRRAIIVNQDMSEKRLKSLFGYSIVYLFGLFIVLAIESMIGAYQPWEIISQVGI